MRWIIPRSFILLQQSCRILGSYPLYSWNNYFREKIQILMLLFLEHALAITCQYQQLFWTCLVL